MTARRPWRGVTLLLVLLLGLSACSLSSVTGTSSSTAPPATAAALATPQATAPSGDQPANAAAVATTATAGAGSSARATPSGAGGSRIVEGGTAEPRTLNPVLAADPLSDALSHLVFDGLVTVDPSNGQPAADLAASWSISDDRASYTFHLRQGVRWSDGTPFSAADVVFSYNLMLNPQARSPRYSRLVEHVAGVSAPDAGTVVVKLTGPDASFLTTLATLGIVPEHVLGSVMPEQIVTDPFGIAQTIGTGPFTLQRWSPGDELTFTRNAGSFRPATVDEYDYRVVAGPQELVDGLANGSIDWGPIDPSALDQARASRVKLLSQPGLQLDAVALQLDSARSRLFLDGNVRRALMLALDRAQLVTSIWHGQAQVATGVIPPASWASAPSKTAYAQDVGQARKLLDDAGWQPGPDGIRLKGGQRLSFKLTADGSDPTSKQTVEWLVQAWKAIGVEVLPDYQKASSIRLIVTQSRDFDALLLGYADDLDPDQSPFFAGGSYTTGLNAERYANPEVDKLLTQALAESDRTKRADLYHQLQDDIMADLPVIPLVFPDETIGLSGRLSGVSITAITLRNRAGVESWQPAGG